MGIKGKKEYNKFKLSLLTVLFVLLCVAISIGAFFYNYVGKFSNNVREKSKTVKPLEVKSKDSPVNILVLGVDIGDPNIKNNESIKRTDTIMVANYNPKNNKLNLLSIPRDTLIQIKGKNQKINAAYAIGGVKYSINAVEEMLDTSINYYVKLNYEGFRKVIDAIGGIDMEIEQDMVYDDNAQNLHINFKKGEKVHLDGKKAEEFFRWRKNNDGSGLADGDLGRIKNQHIFIGKVAEKFKSIGIVTKIDDILKILPENVETNMPVDNMISYGLSVAKLPKENLSISTLKGDAEYIGGVSYFIYDRKKNVDTASVFNSDIGISKSKLKVEVLNGTKIKGLAKDFSKELDDMGYNNVTVGNGSKSSKSKIYIKKGNDSLKEMVKKDFNTDNIEYISENKENFDIIILLGEDHKRLRGN